MIDLLSHVKWFNSDKVIAQPSLNNTEWLVVVILLIAGLLAFRFADQWLVKSKTRKNLDKKLKPLRLWVPLVVRISTSLLLAINVTHDYLLAPNVTSDGSSTSNLISGLFIVAAVLIGLGLWNKAGALTLLAGYLLILTKADFVDVLDHFEYVGIAGYLWLRGPGKHSLDNYLQKKKLTAPDLRKHSLTFYRTSIGIGLATLGLSEKLLNTTAAQDFLNQYDWNVLSAVGVSDRWFIVVAGSVELLVGLALIFNYASRLLILVVLALMLLTAVLLGIDEIYGHLFAVGAVAVLLVHDEKPAKRD